MARTSGSVPKNKSTTTVSRVKRNGVSGTLVRTTNSTASSSSKPKKTYAQLAKEGGNVAAAKKYNASKSSTSESFRPDAPKKMTPKKASISVSNERSIKGVPMKEYPPRKTKVTGGYGGKTKSSGKGSLKKKITKTAIKAKAKMSAGRKRTPMKTSKGKLGCGVNSKRCKAPKRR